MRIINLPNNQIERTNKLFHEAFLSLKIDFMTVHGKKINHDIDIFSTEIWKLSEMAGVIELINLGHIGKDDDVFFFHDICSSGIEALQSIRKVTGAKFTIKGIFHGELTEWAHWFEMGWLEMVDEIFVESEYHKEILTQSIFRHVGNEELIATHEMYQRHMDYVQGLVDKLKVTGLPFRESEASPSEISEKIYNAVLPNKPNPDKLPDLSEYEPNNVVRKMFL